MWRFISLGLFTLICLLAAPVEAQITNFNNVAAPQITLFPQYPAPGERVTVTLEDVSGTVAAATVTWQLDGGIELPAETKNSRNISFITGAAGKSQTITAILTTPGSAPRAIKKTIVPSYLDIIIEPQTYTPPLYAGRALPIYGSIVRVTGLLHGQSSVVDASKYTYLWKLNNTPIGGGAVRGGYQTLYTVPHGRNHTVTLEITNNATGATVARRSVAIETSAVDTQLYEVSVLYGHSRSVVTNNLAMIGNSLTLRAVPYNLDVRAFGNNLFSEWSINRQTTDSGSDRFEITLNRTGAGTAEVEFKVRNLDELVQGDKTSVDIRF